MGAHELYIMGNGFIALPRHQVIYRDEVPGKVELPIPMYLIKTDHGNVLFDTGFSPTWVPVVEKHIPEARFTQDDLLLNRLEAINLAPDDIQYVVLSHLHLDHAGGAALFPKAKLIVQKDEYAYGQYPHRFAKNYYNKVEYDLPHYHWECIDGDQEIVPGVTAILTNGHTPGHQSLVVELPKTGPVILTADCCYLRQHIDQGLISGIYWNPVLALHAVKKIRTLSKLLGAKTFPGHDIEFWKTATLAPKCYT